MCSSFCMTWRLGFPTFSASGKISGYLSQWNRLGLHCDNGTVSLGRVLPRPKSTVRLEGFPYVINSNVFVSRAILQVGEHWICVDLERDVLRQVYLPNTRWELRELRYVGWICQVSSRAETLRPHPVWWEWWYQN